MNTITKEQALDISKKHIFDGLEAFQVTDTLPEACRVYNAPKEGCWYILYPSHFEPGTNIESSRLICVSKSTGQILYDGSASDEG